MYYSFGEHAKKSPQQVIAAAKKQKLSEDALDLITSPFKTAIKKGLKTAVGERGQVVSEEQFIKAIVLKTLKEVGLLPKSNLRKMINEAVAQHKPKRPSHPFWHTHLSNKK